MAVSISIAITQNSQNIENNTSNVTVKVNAKWTYGSFNRNSQSGYLTIDGTKYTFKSTFNENESTSGSETIFTKTLNINHAANGTKTLSCSASYTSGVSSGTVTATGSKVLTTIPRKSSLTVSNGTLGTVQTLTIARHSNSFTHTITYKCGTASGTITTKTTGTSVSFTPPLTLSSQNTAGTSVSITFTLTTYSGNTSLGTNTKTISCTIPASVKPTCTVAVTDTTGYSDTYGNPVKGLSKFKVTVTPTLAYGSAIASYTTTANNVKYTTATFTTGVLSSSGSMTISSTVKDKRGRSGSASVTKTVLDYTAPVIVKLTGGRCDSDGTANDQGEFVQVTFSATITALNNKNTAEYILKYKKSTATEYTEINLTEYANIYNLTNKTYIFPADTGSSYNVELIAGDNHGTTHRSTTASTGFTLMHFGADGRSMSIGKISEESNLFDVGLPARFNSPVYGKIMGLDKLPAIPSGADLNDYMETGCYAITGNAIAETIKNIPVKRAGRLEIISSTGEGIRVTEWSYLRQRYTPYNAENPVWERDISRSDNNVWAYGEWYRSTLSKSMSDLIYGGQKVLWSGGYYMTAGHTIKLSEKISEQNQGVVLVFSALTDGAAGNYWWHHFFVPKNIVINNPGSGHCFTMASGNFSLVAMKYLLIKDAEITGHDNNNLSGTAASGITFSNARFVLRYVLGV